MGATVVTVQKVELFNPNRTPSLEGDEGIGAAGFVANARVIIARGTAVEENNEIQSATRSKLNLKTAVLNSHASGVTVTLAPSGYAQFARKCTDLCRANPLCANWRDVNVHGTPGCFLYSSCHAFAPQNTGTPDDRSVWLAEGAPGKDAGMYKLKGKESTSWQATLFPTAMDADGVRDYSTSANVLASRLPFWLEETYEYRETDFDYKVVMTAKTWEEHERDAVSWGGHMASITALTRRQCCCALAVRRGGIASKRPSGLAVGIVIIQRRQRPP